MTFSDRLPRTYHPQRWIEVDDAGTTPPDSAVGHRVGAASVDAGYFDALNVPILSGRGFQSGDVGSDPNVVIVNQSFVQEVLGGRNPIGRRVRYATRPDEEPAPWHEIVGVVRNLGMMDGNGDGNAGLYHAVAPGDVYPTHMAVHARGDPESFAPRLRTVAAAVDPTLRLHELLPLNQAGFRSWSEFDFLFRLLAAVSSIALLLSLAGIYSIMSFTVSRRTREIGIRVALGADRRRVIAAIFRRPLVQVGLGVVAGGGLVAALVLARPFIYSSDAATAALSARQVGLVVAYAMLMTGVCLLACVVPTRRALRIEPTEALKEDG